MPRLSADLILHAPSFVNAVKQRELDLRGNKIPFIENLGVTKDQFDAFDLTDNDLTKLENFPTLRQLVSLLVSNNRIARIAPNIGLCLPNLEWLVLTNNRIARLEEIDNLTACKQLTHLSLLNNPITTKPNYRLYVLHKVPSLRLLDFKKVTYQERQEAKRVFGELVETKTFEPGTISVGAGTDLTPQQVAELTEAIKNSKDIEEVRKYEQALATGKMPV